MANGAFKFKDNSGNVVAHISGSGTGIMVSGSALGLTGSVDVVGSLSVNGSAIISNYSQLTSSLDTRYVLSGSITQTTWDNIASKPSGIVSGSSQISGLGYAITGSNTFQGNQTINGNVVVTGSLTAQQFIVSSSVTYMTTSFSSGSTKFGDDTGDSHNFTGSVFVTGSLRIPTASSTSNITGTAVGQLFFNTTDNNVYRYNGSSWLSAAGSSGTSGTSGSSGTAGTSGTSGSSGSAGTSGTSGSSGTTGTSGSSGSSGSTGTSGTAGSSGTAGTSGSSGSSGTSGSAGTSGTSGSSGSSGSAGTSGATGTPGSSGSSGSSGTAGTSGSSGSSGSAGTSGAAIINNNTSTYVLTATGTAGTIQGNSGFTFNAGTVTATTFSGALSGNATTATSTPYVTTTLTGTNEANLIYAPIADNDFFRIRVGGTATNSGWAEIATADDGNEPIYVRQYTGVFATVTRTATLLDGSGNTIFPGIISASNYSGTSSGTNTGDQTNISGYATSLNGYANQTVYTILDGPANGPVIKVRYDSATANRYIDIGSKDGNGVYSEGLKLYNGTTMTWLGYTVYHSGNVPTWNQNTTGTASNITAYTINQSVATSSSPTFADTTLTGGLTVGGSLSRGTYTVSSNYVTGADNIVLKGNGSGVSGIFFESEKDGTNINHPSDFAFIQFFPYGIGGSSGEANRLVIGVSNDADDMIVLNPVASDGVKVRVGAGTTDYTVYHSGNVPTWNQNTTGTASNITAYTINQSVGSSNRPTFAGIYVSDSIIRTAAGTGYLSGGYAGAETGSSTGAIYTIGGSYYPTSTSLNNMYGIGYTNISGNVSMTNASGWGMYVAGNGTIGVWLGAEGSPSVFKGHVLPHANNTYNLGSASYGWANVYTNDLHLSNMNKPEGNDVDGTNGTWTIQEGAEDLYIINNNNGKKYKIKLEEI